MTSLDHPRQRRRELVLAGMVGLGGAVAKLLFLLFYHEGSQDLTWPICAAKLLLHGQDVYLDGCPLVLDGGRIDPKNPLTTVLATLPFVYLLREALVAPAVIGLGTAVLTYGILRSRPSWFFLMFASSSFLVALRSAQWSILLTGIYLVPSLLPLVLVKPHTGLPVFLLHMNVKRLSATLLFFGISLALAPAWPDRFLRFGNLDAYRYFCPLLSFPGYLLAASLFFIKSNDGKLLLLYSLVPQRGIYDLLPLWLLPRNRRQMLLLTGLSWVPFLLDPEVYHNLHLSIYVMCSYLPALLIVARNQHKMRSMHEVQ